MPQTSQPTPQPTPQATSQPTPAEIQALLADLPAENPQRRLNQLLYLIPILGAGPAALRLFTGRGGDRRIYRTAVWMALIWLASSGCVGIAGSGAEGAEALPFWVTSSVLMSSYFVASVVMMVKTWRRL
jgi:hypothetical protein